jgi:hypothetical protein
MLVPPKSLQSFLMLCWQTLADLALAPDADDDDDDDRWILFRCGVCLLLQDLVQSCLHGGGGNAGRCSCPGAPYSFKRIRGTRCSIFFP